MALMASAKGIQWELQDHWGNLIFHFEKLLLVMISSALHSTTYSNRISANDLLLLPLYFNPLIEREHRKVVRMVHCEIKVQVPSQSCNSLGTIHSQNYLTGGWNPVVHLLVCNRNEVTIISKWLLIKRCIWQTSECMWFLNICMSCRHLEIVKGSF